MLSFVKIIFIVIAGIFLVSYLGDEGLRGFSLVDESYETSDGLSDRSAYTASYDRDSDGVISDSEYRRGELDRIEEELADLEYEVTRALEEENKSTFRDKVYLSIGEVRTTRPKQEYLTLYTTVPRVKITGWKLKSLITGKSVTIGEHRGTDIEIRDEDYVSIYTGDGSTREEDDTWTIHLDLDKDLWRSEREAIALIDTAGKIVDVVRY